MAFRSINMNLFNMTNRSLMIRGSNTDHGSFVAPFAPPTVLPGQGAEWRIESSGSGTGAAGYLEYTIDAEGVVINFYMDSPSWGILSIQFHLNVGGGRTSDFVFFPIRFALDGSVAPDPVSGPGLVSVLLTNESSDDGDVIVPFPGMSALPNSSFSIGVRNKRDPVSVKTWLKAIGADPQLGLRAAFDAVRSVPSIKRLVEFPIVPPDSVSHA
jgi:hypothetical protein